MLDRRSLLPSRLNHIVECTWFPLLSVVIVSSSSSSSLCVCVLLRLLVTLPRRPSADHLMDKSIGARPRLTEHAIDAPHTRLASSSSSSSSSFLLLLVEPLSSVHHQRVCIFFIRPTPPLESFQSLTWVQRTRRLIKASLRLLSLLNTRFYWLNCWSNCSAPIRRRPTRCGQHRMRCFSTQGTKNRTNLVYAYLCVTSWQIIDGTSSSVCVYVRKVVDRILGCCEAAAAAVATTIYHVFLPPPGQERTRHDTQQKCNMWAQLSERTRGIRQQHSTARDVCRCSETSILICLAALAFNPPCKSMSGYIISQIGTYEGRQTGQGSSIPLSCLALPSSSWSVYNITSCCTPLGEFLIGPTTLYGSIAHTAAAAASHGPSVI